MRLLGLSCLVVAGCSETGAHLTLSAPNGPASAMSFRVVLAKPDVVPLVNGQRVTPARSEVQSVSYYLQRTVAGGEHDTIAQVDGFTVRVAPDITISETAFVPFVLVYDGENETGNIVGVATFVAPDSNVPSPILVKRDEIDKYTLTVEPVVQVSDREPAVAGQVQLVTCIDRDQKEFVSGVVWRPKHGGELRLVFPDDGSLDASNRALDLDCDGHPVTIESSGSDCDDTRAWFHRDAAESCDGFDTNCDSLQAIAVACAATNVCSDPTTGTGIALCNDTNGGMVGQCQGDAQCLCANSSTGCNRCFVDNELGSAAGTVKPCQPTVGILLMGSGRCTDLTPCVVEMVGVTGGWVAEVSGDEGTFGLKTTNVHDKVYLKVKRPEGVAVDIPGTRGTSTGEVDLVITGANGAKELWPIDLELSVDAPLSTCSAGGLYQMYCTQL